MKNYIYATLPLLAALPLVGEAQTTPAAQPSAITPPPSGGSDPLNRFGLNYRMAFNISAKFSGLGGFSTFDPGPNASGANHWYDDGHNLVDPSGNFSHQTSLWGYDRASQISGNSITMHSSSSAANIGSSGSAGDPQSGFELTYNRQLGGGGSMKWGIEAAFGYTALAIQDNSTLYAPVAVTADTYNFSGVQMPNPGNYTPAPNSPRLGDIPSRNTAEIIPNGASIMGSRMFTADIYSGRLGPYIQIPLSQVFSVSLSAGVAIVGIDSQFGFNETVTVTKYGTHSEYHSGAGNGGTVLVGGYVGASLAAKLSKVVDLSVGAMYQNTGQFTQTLSGNQQVMLDLGSSIFVSVGVGISF